MSRIWKLPITIPSTVTISLSGTNVTVKGTKWSLEFNHSPLVEVTINDTILTVTPKDENASALWGTTRAIISNMIHWVTEWYTKSLEINWVWYKFEINGNTLILSVGFSHKIEKSIPQDIEVKFDEKKKNTIYLTGIDKQKVWQFASQIKFLKKPEPYKGKGIKYVWENIRRKAGKTGKK